MLLHLFLPLTVSSFFCLLANENKIEIRVDPINVWFHFRAGDFAVLDILHSNLQSVRMSTEKTCGSGRRLEDSPIESVERILNRERVHTSFRRSSLC